MNASQNLKDLLASNLNTRNFIITYSQTKTVTEAMQSGEVDECQIKPDQILGHMLHSIAESSKSYGKQASFVAGFIVVPLTEVLKAGIYEYQDTLDTLGKKVMDRFLPEDVRELTEISNDLSDTNKAMGDFLKQLVGEENYDKMKIEHRMKCDCPNCAQWRIDNGYRQTGEHVDEVVKELEQDLGKVQTREQYLLDADTDELMRDDINELMKTADPISKRLLEFSLADGTYKDLPIETFKSLIERAELIKSMNQKDAGILDDDAARVVKVERQNLRSDLDLIGSHLSAKNKERDTLEKALEILHTEGVNALQKYARKVKDEVAELEDDVQAKQVELVTHTNKYLIEKDTVTLK